MVGTNSAQTAALSAYDAQLCVLPPKQNGSKMPDADSWKQFQTRRPSRETVEAWYANGRTGVGIVTGAVSGNLELFEFDDADTFAEFLEVAEQIGLGNLIARIRAGFEERTPGGGIHWLIRCSKIGSSTKLARRPKLTDEMRDPHDHIKTLIETKGEGGYVITHPSNGSVHPSGKPYELVSGGFDSIATITPAERTQLHDLARTFDQLPEKPIAQPHVATAASGGRPGDDFAHRTNWRDIMVPAGWTLVFRRGDVEYWRRPGKDSGLSATTNYAGSDLLYVFSSSTDFEPERGYGKFTAHAILNYTGDFTAAARELKFRGFGNVDHDGPGDGTKQQMDRVAVQHVGTPIDDWPALGRIPTAPAVPTLPVEMVPEPLRAWVVDTAGQACLPLECHAAPAIVAAASVVGRAVAIRPWQRSGYVVVPNLWGAVIARSGAMKTSIIAEGIGPVSELAATAHERHREEAARARAAAERCKAEVEGLKKGITEATRKGEAAGDREAQLAVKFAELEQLGVYERRYLTNDSTVEKLSELLQHNPRGLLVVRDELSGLLHTCDRPGHEGDRAFYLEGWNGHGTYTIDRIGRGTLRLEAITLSIMGGIQPGPIAAYVREASSNGAGADGLLPRFQMLVWPDALPAWQQPQRWPDTAARQRAYAVFRWLDDLDPDALGTMRENDGDIPYLRFGPEAQVLADEWREQWERRLRSEAMASTPAFEAHLAKYRSLFPALALIFHLIAIAAGELAGPVSLEATQLAAAWCDFLEHHAKKLYAAEIVPGLDAAARLAERVRAGDVPDGMTVRELYRASWSGLSTVERVDAALAVLEAASWVRVTAADTGGRPSRVVRLHPDLRSADSG